MAGELLRRVKRVKNVAMMEMREKMGPVELVNWWKYFIGNIPPDATFESLDTEVRDKLLKWEEALQRDSK